MHTHKRTRHFTAGELFLISPLHMLWGKTENRQAYAFPFHLIHYSGSIHSSSSLLLCCLACLETGLVWKTFHSSCLETWFQMFLFETWFLKLFVACRGCFLHFPPISMAGQGQGRAGHLISWKNRHGQWEQVFGTGNSAHLFLGMASVYQWVLQAGAGRHAWQKECL